MRSSHLFAALCSTLLLGCLSGRADSGASEPGGSVWAVDLVRTLPGRQTEYLRSIEANWAGARDIARERGVVLSYRALAAVPDEERGWDVLLMTEYADTESWERREEAFQEIFASPEFVRVPPTRPSAELREFLSSGVVLQAVVERPGR